jgi:hypothetical protein
MPPWLRTTLGVVAGVLVGGLVVFAVEAVNSTFFPLPADVSVDDADAMARHLAEGGPVMLLGVLVGWALGSFIGAWLATVIAKSAGRAPAVAVAIFFMAGAVMTMLTIPHPVWFWIVGLAVFVPAALLGEKMGRRSTRTPVRP